MFMDYYERTEGSFQISMQRVKSKSIKMHFLLSDIISVSLPTLLKLRRGMSFIIALNMVIAKPEMTSWN